MFKKILIPVDDVHDPGAAPKAALAVAGRNGSSLTLFNVIDIDSLDRPEVNHELESQAPSPANDGANRVGGAMIAGVVAPQVVEPGQEKQPVGIGARLVEQHVDLARRQLSGIASGLSSGNVTVSGNVAAGDPDAEILREINHGDYDLAVLELHKTGFLHRLFSGSTTSEVLKDAEIPVLVVKRGEFEDEEPGEAFSHLVAIVDSKPEGSQSADAALELARQYRVPVTFVVNAEPPVPVASHPAPGAIEISASQVEEEYARAKESVRDLVNSAEQDGIEASSTVVFTGLVNETKRLTSNFARPLVITDGIEGLSLARALLGSGTEQLARSVDAPVLNIPHTWKLAGKEKAE